MRSQSDVRHLIQSSVDTILLDIEGTICSITFVKDVLYPYSDKKVLSHATKNWANPEFQQCVQKFPQKYQDSPETLAEHVHQLIAQDSKASYLKQLQGILWRKGYETGEYTTPLYPDVLPTFNCWQKASKRLAIFSSGSVGAQKLFFTYVGTGDSGSSVQDLRPYFADGDDYGFFDTTNAGPKREKTSYERILSSLRKRPEQVLFVSDVGDELRAADAAGMPAVMMSRPGNAELTEAEKQDFLVFTSLEDIPLS